MNEIKIGLLWHSSNSGNLGVGALTVGNMAIIREVAASLGLVPRFTIFGSADTGPAYINDAEVFPLTARTMLDPRGFGQRVSQLDCVLDIGGGDSFTDIYPLKRFAWIVLTKVIVINRRIPLIFSPQTIGPFFGATAAKRALGRIASWTVRRARQVVVRDDQSIAMVRTLVRQVEPVFSVDVAFALPWTPAPRLTSRPRIGLNVSGLLWRGGHTGRNEFNLDYDYKTLMTAVIEYLLAAKAYTVELICHVNTPHSLPESDGAVADELAAHYPELVRVADFASPSAAKSHISGLDLLIGARMHACIAAFSSGVPVVPISYSRKFEGLFGSLDYTRLVPCTGMTTAAAEVFVCDAIARRQDLEIEVANGLRQVSTRLDAYRAVLSRLFSDITT